MDKPVLISFKLCPYVQRSVITLLQKNVDFDIRYIELSNKPDWFLKLSPLGKVPVLQIKDEVLFESAVINEYLDETHPPPLAPSDPLLRAKERAWTEFGSNLLVLQYGWTMASKETDSEKNRMELLSRLQHLEGVVAEPDGDGEAFFAGKEMHLVDTAFAPFFMRMAFLKNKNKTLDLLGGFPKITRWSESLLSLPSVQKSVLPEVESGYIDFIKDHKSYLGSQL